MGSNSGFQFPSVGILAGGEGARFDGADKPWVELKSKPLVQWTLDAVRPQAGEILVSANRNLDRYRALGIDPVQDDANGAFEGPMAGIVRLLEAAKLPWLMCLPCDLVRVPPDLAQRFHDIAEASSADIVVLADAQGIHPTICYLKASLAADARACFDAGERAPRRWFRRHRLEQLRGATPWNVNSPERLSELEGALELGE